MPQRPRTRRYGLIYSKGEWINVPPPLTPVHSAVAFCLLEGMENEEMAEAIGIARQTVDMHLHTLRRRLGCHSTRRLIVKLVRMADNGEQLPNA